VGRGGVEVPEREVGLDQPWRPAAQPAGIDRFARALEQAAASGVVAAGDRDRAEHGAADARQGGVVELLGDGDALLGGRQRGIGVAVLEQRPGPHPRHPLHGLRVAADARRLVCLVRCVDRFRGASEQAEREDYGEVNSHRGRALACAPNDAGRSAGKRRAPPRRAR
jgi:hypothetical protein